MKMVSYLKDGHDQLALYLDGVLFDLDRLHPDLPARAGEGVKAPQSVQFRFISIRPNSSVQGPKT